MSLVFAVVFFLFLGLYCTDGSATDATATDANAIDASAPDAIATDVNATDAEVLILNVLPLPRTYANALNANATDIF